MANPRFQLRICGLNLYAELTSLNSYCILVSSITQANIYEASLSSVRDHGFWWRSYMHYFIWLSGPSSEKGRPSVKTFHTLDLRQRYLEAKYNIMPKVIQVLRGQSLKYVLFFTHCLMHKYQVLCQGTHVRVSCIY